jgi:hypothetical protein
MTLGDLVFRVSRSLGLNDDAGSDELKLMQKWANDSVIDVLLETHIYVSTFTQTLTAGTSEYQLSSSILVIVDGKGTTSAFIGPYEVVSMAEMFEIQAISPVGSARKIIAIEGNLLIVSPTPDTGESITFYGVPRPTALVASGLGTTSEDAHDPSQTTYGGIPAEYHRANEYYMLWRGAEYDDKRSMPYGKGAAQGYLDQYRSECNSIRKHKRNRAGRQTHGFRAPGYPGRTFRSGRNDVYPRTDR